MVDGYRYGYDRAGNVTWKQNVTPGAFTKTQYDSLGRAVLQFTGYDVDEPVELSGTWDEACVVDSTDTIVQQSQTWYNTVSEVVASATYQRLPADSYVTVNKTWYDAHPGCYLSDPTYNCVVVRLALERWLVSPATPLRTTAQAATAGLAASTIASRPHS